MQILGRAGVRVGELCEMKIGHLRLHDPDGARFRIPDPKTETRIREVQMSPDLVHAVLAHIEQLRRAGRPTGPKDHLVPNLKGGRIDRQRVAKIVREAAASASAKLAAQGLPPLPHLTPHSLRRTYIWVCAVSGGSERLWGVAAPPRPIGKRRRGSSRWSLGVRYDRHMVEQMAQGPCLRMRERRSGMGVSASPSAEAGDGPLRLALAASSAVEAETVGDQATAGEAWRRYRLIKDALRDPDELLVEGIALSEAAIDLAAASRSRP